MILVYDSGTKADHDAAQDDHAQDAPEQHPVLIFARDGEKAEDQRDDEDIVHRQRLFHHEGGQVLCRGGAIHLPPDKAREGQAQHDVHGRHAQAFGHADFVIVPVKDAQVKGQKADDQCQEHEPHPQWLAQKEKKKDVQDCDLYCMNASSFA